MTKDELLNEFETCFPDLDLLHTVKSYWASALDRYALSIVEQSVPEHWEPEQSSLSGLDRLQKVLARTFNDCREQTLAKARQLTSHA